ncbi:MAG: hypothetical protein ACD_30C00029G0010 [uncultured bacterium]|uniref:Uncharacterized protein n=1 Tax=Candidatus Daviesbacteria bacterium RIFCSPHIGHO2_12_FULL_37_16 TaxID=1797778 RepID=A0A1F5K3N1_9BACT|nr:MAG: hypothetical protein ACD_30C00029G0010 [uncultured bacterium]OGE32385.1 MAG: hypothetical protein A3C99_02785 [Candidatus Daviesbacteria bacterium RIFCSPHIGHO2_02_FULL_37_9]OGE35593.1 MAG: hypothetical protein A3E66_02465 [Candidatus Daviesbacteria bacterium RIFCSPHIGHO2_12_FULL_37_16]
MLGVEFSKIETKPSQPVLFPWGRVFLGALVALGVNFNLSRSALADCLPADEAGSQEDFGMANESKENEQAWHTYIFGPTYLSEPSNSNGSID